MTAEQSQAYDDALVVLLEAVWGEGYLSPGGPEEVRAIVAGVEFAGKAVLDLGCGTGGITRFLAASFRPASIIGVDVEPGVVNRAVARAGGMAGLAFRAVAPGPLPFPDDTFDVVVSKDAMVHIADKEALFGDLHRVLRPGGVLAASDWMSGHDGPVSPAMAYYLEQEGLGFGMASAARYRAALERAGFTDIRIVDRNDWYQVQARAEHAALSGPLYERLAAKVGKDFLDREIEVWRAMTVVVDSGELRPSHLRARKPA